MKKNEIIKFFRKWKKLKSDLYFNSWPPGQKNPTLKGSKYFWVPKYFYFLLGGFELKLRFHSFLRIDSFRGVHLQQMTEREHIGLFGQIWDKRLRQKYSCLYSFCLWMFHKNNGTNEKVFPQGFISATKKYFFILYPLKIREMTNF